MLNVRTRVVVSRAMPLPEQRAAFAALLDDLGQDMADQVRLNIVRFGKPGGDGGWAPVSGWKQGNIQEHKRAAKAHTAAANRTEGEQAKRHREQAKKHRTAVKDLKARGASEHAAYALRKETGKTPGHGKFHADELLRDTEALFASVDAEVRTQSNSAVISLIAEGTAPGRSITNQRLLEIHALGEGDMPKRDPTSDMTNYEARVQKRLDAFWDRVFMGAGGRVSADHARGGSQSAGG